uniref:SDR1 protein n=1 Tax=Schistosoma japonicum TaxID=6182 RepID=C1L6D7_SCHJA|nr:SDR1 protein [Schistosoma japonicum]
MTQYRHRTPQFESIVEHAMFIFTLFLCCFWEIVHRILQTISPVYKDLSSDVILITGAGNGIGRLMCLEFAKFCPNIVAVDKNEKSLVETSELVHKETGVQIKVYVCDLRHKKAIDELSTNILRELGKVTVLVNNAGVMNAKFIDEFTSDEIEDCFKVNVLSHFYLIQAFLPSMLNKMSENPISNNVPVKFRHPRGHIVCISSIAGLIPLAGGADYCASKAAAILLSESVELELLRLGVDNEVHVTRVLPFLLNTDMFRGVTPKHPLLFPIVDAGYCASRIVQSVRLNERVVYVTARYRILPILKMLFPTKMIHCLYEYANTGTYVDQLKLYRKKIDGANR